MGQLPVTPEKNRRQSILIKKFPSEALSVIMYTDKQQLNTKSLMWYQLILQQLKPVTVLMLCNQPLMSILSHQYSSSSFSFFILRYREIVWPLVDLYIAACFAMHLSSLDVSETKSAKIKSHV